MNIEVARRLNRLNQEFYEREAASFSATRQTSWPGWERCWAASGLKDSAGAHETFDASNRTELERPELRVLDVACGNLRFARFLEGVGPNRSIAYCGVDNNRELGEKFEVPAGWRFSFCERDIVGELLGDGNYSRVESSRQDGFPHLDKSPHRGSQVPFDVSDLTVCFGFLHHVSTFQARVRLMNELLAATEPGGICCISFWRFMSDPKLAAKARRTTEEGLLELGLTADDLDEGDYLVGWQNLSHVYRYCHSFSDAEVDALLDQLKPQVELVDRFYADGRSGALNEYLVLRRE